MSDKDKTEITAVPPYDPATDLGLDLTHLEKLRVTALMLAIQYYERTIVHDADMYNAIKMHNGKLRPAHPDHVADIAVQFASFLLGHPIPLSEATQIMRSTPTEHGADVESPDWQADKHVTIEEGSRLSKKQPPKKDE